MCMCVGGHGQAIARQCGILTEQGKVGGGSGRRRERGQRGDGCAHGCRIWCVLQVLEGPEFRRMTPAQLDEVLPFLQVQQQQQAHSLVHHPLVTGPDVSEALCIIVVVVVTVAGAGTVLARRQVHAGGPPQWHAAREQGGLAQGPPRQELGGRQGQAAAR